MPPSVYVDSTTPTSSLSGGRTVLTALTPSTVRPGDTLLFVVLGSGPPVDQTLLPPGWSLIARLNNSGVTGRADVLRRIVTGAEPAQHAIACLTNGAYTAVMLAYRGLDPLAAPLAADNADAVATNNFTAPAMSTANYSDLYLLIVNGSPATTFVPTFGAFKRYEVTATGYTTAVIDYHPEAAGAVSVARTAVTSIAATGQAVGMVLASTAAPLARPLPSPGRGSIGLPAIGV